VLILQLRKSSFAKLRLTRFLIFVSLCFIGRYFLARSGGDTMKKIVRIATFAAATSMVMSGVALAQQPAPPPAPPQYPNMSFFITSTPGANGANFGGLDGADLHCQTLAAKAGAGSKVWRAYLSQQAMDGKTAINAKDRIGKGPWMNVDGVEIAANVADLHTPEKVKINVETGMTETGRRVMSRQFIVNYHDILTGSQADGTAPAADKDMTCGNWTKSGEGAAMVGHHDRMGLADTPAAKSWNASHPSRACDNASLRATGGNGLLYCFVAN
jgi:hypothetical protein